MTGQSKWRTHFQENKTLFIILAVGLFLMELEIFAMAVMKTGKEFPFPFRAWFAGAVGLPIAAVLLFGFFIKAYEALFFKKDDHANTPPPPQDSSTDRLDRMIRRVSRLNIFVIGAFVLLFALGLFAVPNLLSEFGRYAVPVISKYRWVVLAIIAVFLGLIIWIIFLRYLLARKTIEAHADMEKYRLQLELLAKQEDVAQLTMPDELLQLPPSAPSEPSEPSKPSKPSKRSKTSKTSKTSEPPATKSD